MNTELSKVGDIDRLLRIIEQQCVKSLDLENSDRTVSLRNLYQEAVREAKRLQKEQTDIALVSVSVRNIFEIMLIIDHVASSDAAVRLWIGQLQQDALDIHEGLMALCAKHGIRSFELESSRDNVLNSGNAQGVTPARPFIIKDIATQIGLAEDYDAIFKLCSKIVHPTSIRVNLPGAFDKDENYKNTLIHTGVHYLANIAASSKRDFA